MKAIFNFVCPFQFSKQNITAEDPTKQGNMKMLGIPVSVRIVIFNPPGYYKNGLKYFFLLLHKMCIKQKH